METDDKFLKKIKKNLLGAGEKVINSNHRLSEQLRKILDETNFLENQRVIELIREIEQIALGILQEQAITYNEKFACELTRFNGQKIRFDGKSIRNM